MAKKGVKAGVKKGELNETEKEFLSAWSAHYPEIELTPQYHEYREWPTVREQRPIDLAHLPSRTGIEVQGGIRMHKSGHNTPGGILKDYKKSRLASEKGWLIIPVATEDINIETFRQIENTIITRLVQLIAAQICLKGTCTLETLFVPRLERLDGVTRYWLGQMTGVPVAGVSTLEDETEEALLC